VEMVGEMIPGHPALLPAHVPLAGVSAGHRHRRILHPVHRPLPTSAVRLHQRSTALVLAGVLLRRQRWPRHRRVPTIRPRTRTWISRLPGHRLPLDAFPGTCAGQVVAAGDPPLPDHLSARQQLVGLELRR
jgi:hypothetical protein